MGRGLSYTKENHFLLLHTALHITLTGKPGLPSPKCAYQLRPQEISDFNPEKHLPLPQCPFIYVPLTVACAPKGTRDILHIS